MKIFLKIVVTGLLTLGALASVVWIAKVPIAVAVCGAIKRNVSPDECIKAVAVHLSKPELCEKVKGVDFKYENPPKQECYSEIAARTNDTDLCAKVEGGFISETEFTCFYRVATRNKNAAACAMLEGSESRMGIVQDKNTCLTTIGKTEADAASAPTKKGPAPIILGLGAGALDLIAYGLLGLWALWIVMNVAMKAMKKKNDGPAAK